MRTSDFTTKPSSKVMNETLNKKFGEKLDIENYSDEQLKKAEGLIESRITVLKKGKFNETLESEEFHRLKLMQDIVRTTISERAVSKAQQQAAGAALAAKRGKGTVKGASKEMSKMSTKELEKFASTKHKGLPKHVEEAKKVKEAPNEGNAFGKAVRDAKKDGIQKGEKVKVGGKTYPVKEAAKPDFLDLDKDGNKKEPMKKAAKDKKKVKESVMESISRLLREGEESKAELIMAVKDMVDKFTGWSEDIAQMQAQTAMEMADAIRDEMGADQAEAFTASVQPALDAAFQSVKSAREALNNSVGSLTGVAPTPMGAEPAMPGDELGGEMPADAGMDMDIDAEVPGDDAEMDVDVAAPVDRAKRESIEHRLRLTKLLVGR